MRTTFSLVLILFILPEVKDFSNLKTCDIINSSRSGESVLSDSISQALGRLSYLDKPESPSAFSILAHIFTISYSYRESTLILIQGQGGQEMKITQAGKLWLDYHRSNSQKKYG